MPIFKANAYFIGSEFEAASGPKAPERPKSPILYKINKANAYF